MKITFEHVHAASTSMMLNIEHWSIEASQHWGIFNLEGDVGAILARLLCGELSVLSGTLSGVNGSIALVSLREQQRLLEIELAHDDTDFLDHQDFGSTVYQLVYELSSDEALTQRLLNELDLAHLQTSGFRQLSTGESRRLMLARALANRAELLVLDEPYAGLDTAHRASLERYLKGLSQTTQLLMMVSREADMPSWIEHIALFHQGRLETVMDKNSWDSHPIITQLKNQSNAQSDQMVAALKNLRHMTSFEDPIFEIKQGKVAYTDKLIFSDINWRINHGEHWQIKGPNGCGKSTLLGLIMGDHPQCYSNDIHIFGLKRGSGETIWDIKKNIGIISSALHLQYRVNCRALDVILSGFYDSIGLYQRPTQEEVTIAKQWLNILQMDAYTKTFFRQLEYGQQRLLLIARALVKRPTLLILDEPYQGLDFLGRRLIKQTLELIATENLSQLIYVSHYQEDSLMGIHHYLDFVPNECGGYDAQLTSS
jgi:molybdate transport system ATP-binding protein